MNESSSLRDFLVSNTDRLDVRPEPATRSASGIEGTFGNLQIVDNSTQPSAADSMRISDCASPQEEAQKAVGWIRNMGGNPLAYTFAAGELKSEASVKAFNDLQVKVKDAKTNESCLVQAQWLKSMKAATVREVSCD